MKPPVCAYCDKRFNPQQGGGLVTFVDYEPLPKGFVGHPKGMLWFCGRHLKKATSMRHQSSNNALKAFRFPANIVLFFKALFPPKAANSPTSATKKKN